jgi:hypothetical protein
MSDKTNMTPPKSAPSRFAMEAVKHLFEYDNGLPADNASQAEQADCFAKAKFIDDAFRPLSASHEKLVEALKIAVLNMNDAEANGIGQGGSIERANEAISHAQSITQK